MLCVCVCAHQVSQLWDRALYNMYSLMLLMTVISAPNSVQITHLPSELCQLQKLDSLLLEGLPLLALPTTIAQQGLKTLKRYLHLKAQGSSPWHTLPVMVVGPEGSGKTTLLARLRGDDLTGIEPTIGLQVSGRTRAIKSCMQSGFCL